MKTGDCYSDATISEEPFIAELSVGIDGVDYYFEPEENITGYETAFIMRFITCATWNRRNFKNYFNDEILGNPSLARHFVVKP